MTEQTHHTDAAGPRPDALLIGGFVVLCAALLWYFSSQQQQQLRASSTGFDGLQIWLTENGAEARSFSGGWTIDSDTIGLAIVPIYDSAPDSDRTPPQTTEELLFQQDEFDIITTDLRRRAEMVQTMVVLPKWRTGMRLTGLSHPALLIDLHRSQGIMHDLIGRSAGKLRLLQEPFSDFDYAATDGTDLTARFYVAQVFDGFHCAPLVGTVGRMVLGICPLGKSKSGAEVLVLSDPDLLNNHGLRLGDNALIAADLLPALVETGNILIDYSRWVWFTDESDVIQRDRTWADIRRFFDYPFSVLWSGAGLMMCIVLWRAGLRYGPVRISGSKLTASKMQAIAARARLMRLTGQDGALLSDYVTARITAVSAAVFGAAHPGADAKEAAYLKFMDRNQPERAANLRALLAEIRALPAHISAANAISYVNEFERILEQLAYDT